MLGIIAVWLKSHTDTSFYRQVRQISWLKMWSYLLIAYFLLSLVEISYLSVRFGPTWQARVEQTAVQIYNHFPEQLNLKVYDHRPNLTENNPIVTGFPQEPVVVEFPDPIQPDLAGTDYQDAKLLVIATQAAQLAQNEPASYAALLVLDQNGLSYFWQNQLINTLNPYWLDLANQNTFGSGDPQNPDASPEFIIINRSWLAQQGEYLLQNQSSLALTMLIVAFVWLWLLRLLGRVLLIWFFNWLLLPFQKLFGQAKTRMGTSLRQSLLLMVITEEIALISKILYPNQHVISFWSLWLLLFFAVEMTKNWSSTAKKQPRVKS